MRNSAKRLVSCLMIPVVSLTAGCVDAIREGAVGGIGSAVENAIAAILGVFLLPLQTLVAS